MRDWRMVNVNENLGLYLMLMKQQEKYFHPVPSFFSPLPHVNSLIH